MKKYSIKKNILIIFLWAYNQAVPRTVHVFGDSHASFCFRNGPVLTSYETFELPVSDGNNKNMILPFAIYWLGPITMHRVGRDGLSFLDLRAYGVQENDLVVFVFGEIDVRCHIGKQRDKNKRNLEDILDQLVSNYIATIKENQSHFKKITCVVCSVTPPIDGTYRNNPEYPFYGTLADRVLITKKLNVKLKSYADRNNLLFLDIYSIYSDFDGSLNLQLADSTVHIDSQYNFAIKNKLIELFACNFILGSA